MTAIVEYRDVPGFPGYRVGDDGSVWSRRQRGVQNVLATDWHELKLFRNRWGYQHVHLHSGNGRPCTRKVCGLVCAAFHGPRQSGMECRHLNGRIGDDRADNLAWGTKLENENDKRLHGTMAIGERNGLCKLSSTDIAAILDCRGTMTQKACAAQFGCSRSHVGRLWAGIRRRVS
jgi:hypothetical protein